MSLIIPILVKDIISFKMVLGIFGSYFYIYLYFIRTLVPRKIQNRCGFPFYIGNDRINHLF